ncbi:MAG TPA: hypothetical protein VE974_13215 [Thermoanaerobaculia bacterium]|nr:hypothetical protein [Thermoanaerobaculia bacterium]
MGANRSTAPVAFINLPYARRYEKVYLAFIVGVSGYGLVPTAAVRDPSSRYQLDRIFELIRPRIHDISPESVLGCLMNALARQKHQPTFANLRAIYTVVEKMAQRIKRDYSNDLFDTRPFADLAYVASEAAQLHIPSLVR